MGKVRNDTTDSAERQREHLWGPLYHQLPFPVKLHMLVSSEEVSELWWIDSGVAFAVDRERYKKNIMSVFFDQKKFRSLQTLLWKYDFCTVASINNLVNDVIVFHHKYFVRDSPNLCQLIRRKNHVPHSSKCLPDYEEEEDYTQVRRDRLRCLVERMRAVASPDTCAAFPSIPSTRPSSNSQEHADITPDPTQTEKISSSLPIKHKESVKTPNELDQVQIFCDLTEHADYQTMAGIVPWNEAGDSDNAPDPFEAVFEDLF